MMPNITWSKQIIITVRTKVITKQSHKSHYVGQVQKHSYLFN